VVALGPTTLGLVTTTGQIESLQRSGTRIYQVPAGTRPWVVAAGAASGHVFWVSHGASVYREDVTTARRIGSQVTLPDAPFGVVADGSGGIYVERANPNDLPTVKSLRYYSPTTLASASPRPTAERAAGEVEGLAVDPTGGVVYTDSGGALIHWNPAGAALR
jgi:streptogramin lyase